MPSNNVRFHGYGNTLLQMLCVPTSPMFEGRFGRLFRTLPVFDVDPDALRALADAMTDEAAGDDNPTIPAGYTYLGQFIDHDITFDPTSSLQKANDPAGLVNFRTPRYDLDSLYGSGPDDDPFMYDDLGLIIGRNTEDTDDDLPRNVLGRAIIGDPRNDENTIVSQLQLAFLKLHNRVLDDVAAGGSTGSDLFKEAQRQVRWHYQWVVVHDYLRRSVGSDLLDTLLTQDATGETVHLTFYKPKKNAFMPLEFSAAAFRFGHSQVRARYRINNTVPVLPIFDPAPDPGPLADFRGFRPLPGQWTISWPNFFELDDQAPTLSRRIDAKIAAPLFTLPGTDPADLDMRSLPRRNLLRGRALNLPAGQDVAAHMGEDVLTEADLGVPGRVPLWFYVLKEAEVTGGEHLGRVGGRIVAETLLGLLQADPLSYLRVQPNWTPTFGSGGVDFDMPALLRFAVPDQATRF